MPHPSSVGESTGNRKECSIAFENRLVGRLAWGGKDKVTSKSVAARAQPSADHR